MPAFRRHRLVHVHIPKTGGTAIESWFHEIGDMQWGPESWLGEARRQGRWYEYQHLTRQELRELSGHEFDAFEPFAVVRNPYARLVSDYLWRQDIKRLNPNSKTRFFDSFESFLGAIPDDVDSGWSGHIRAADRAEANFLIHIRPQHQYVFGRSQGFQADEVLRFENLSRELDEVLQRRGRRPPGLQAHTERDWSAYYDRERFDLVNRIYSRDLESLGYERL